MKRNWDIRQLFNQKGFFRYPPILAYHHIVAENSSTPYVDYSLTTGQFEAQMRFLHDHGYRCLSLLDLLQTPDSNGPKKTFVLTFDDGFEDFYTQAFPILNRYGFTATVFIVTDLIEKTSQWIGETGSPMLKWAQILELDKAGFTFGSHTCSHPSLPDLSEDQIWHELSTGKDLLETRLGKPIYFLAYSFGESNDAIRKMALQLDYKLALGVNTGEPGIFNLWRCEFRHKSSLRIFAFKLTNWYRAYLVFRGWFRENTATGRLIRKIKYKLINSSLCNR